MTDTKTALVTGALGVLGEAVVQGLLEDGCRVVLVDLDQDKLDRRCRELPRGRPWVWAATSPTRRRWRPP